jgi:hypothetical protein
MKNDDRVDVLLLAAHSHLGEQKQKGDVINVTAAQAQWLVTHEVAKIQVAKSVKQSVGESLPSGE